MAESWVIPLGIGAAFVALMIAPVVEARRAAVRRVRFACPVAGRAVSVEFLDRAPFGVAEPVDVRSCSAFDDPLHPSCEKECLGWSAAARGG